METPAQCIDKLNAQSESEYQVTVVDKMGYDPKEEMRINKLEKMCFLLNSTDKHCERNKYGAQKPIADEHIDFFFEIIEDVKPLMFKMTEEMRNVEVDHEAMGELPIDVPFQTFSIQPADDWHGLYTQRSDAGMLNATLSVIHEETPTCLIIYSLYNFIPNDNQNIAMEFVERSILMLDEKPIDTDSLYTPLAMYLSKLDNRTAKVEYTARIKRKNRNTKKKETIKLKTQAIFIDPSKKFTQKTFGTREIEWTYSWEVRGHWRRLKGVGKNRTGQKNVPGWTWVKSHTKGVGDIIKKDRVVR